LRFGDGGLPAPFERFTAVAVPNPHVIAVVEDYSEPALIELGKRADEVFAAGANVSFLQPLGDTGLANTGLANTGLANTGLANTAPANTGGAAPEVFVRTFERGAGLTPSCGSGVVASRAACSRASGPAPAERMIVRNAGGVAAASI